MWSRALTMFRHGSPPHIQNRRRRLSFCGVIVRRDKTGQPALPGRGDVPYYLNAVPLEVPETCYDLGITFSLVKTYFLIGLRSSLTQYMSLEYQ